MKKLFILIRSVLFRKQTAVFLLSLLLSVSVFVIIVFFEQYEYLDVPYKTVRNADFGDSVFFLGYFDVYREGFSTVRELREYKTRDANIVRSEIAGFDAFDRIIEPLTAVFMKNGEYFEAILYPDQIIDKIRVKPDSGRWLSAASGTAEAVLVGEKWKNFSVGDSIVFDDGTSAAVVGKMKGNTLVPSFHGSVRYAGDIFNQADGFVLMNSAAVSDFESLSADDRHYFIIKMKPDAADEHKAALLDYLEQHGTYIDFETVLSNTEEYMSDWVSTHFPIPAFFILIATVCYLSICSVIIHQSVNEQAKYMIMGCTKRKSTLTIIYSLVAAFALPVTLAVTAAVFFPDLLHIAGKSYGELYYIVNSRCVVPGLIYVLLMAASAVIIPIVYYSDRSPMKIYLREK